MNCKKLAIRFLIIFIIIALMLPAFISRVKNENGNKNVVLALNYNNFKDSLSTKDFQDALDKGKTAGMNTALIPEESINSLMERGDVTALTFSELKERFDAESEEIVSKLADDISICANSYVLITKRSSSSDFLTYWIPKKYTSQEFTTFETSQGATVFVLYKEIIKPGLEPVGFNEESIINAKEKGFDIALTLMISANSTQDYIKSIDALVKKYDIKYLNIKENSGHISPNPNEEKTIKAFSKLIKDNKLTLVVTENSDQLSNQKPFGYAAYIDSADGRVARCYQTGEEKETGTAAAESRYFKMLNSVIDRNARFVTVNILKNEKESSKARCDLTIEATTLLVNKLHEFGYNTDGFDTQFNNYNGAGKSVSILSLVLMIIMWLTMIEILCKKPLKKLEIISLIGIILSVPFTLVVPEGIVSLYPTLFAVTAPCFCITTVLFSIEKLKEKLPFIALLLVGIALSIASICLCGIVQSSLLSGLDYYINTSIFRGIKVSLIFPIVYSVIALFMLYKKDGSIMKQALDFVNSQIKVGWVIICALVAVVGIIYIKRSGNVLEISSAEALMRNTITNLMEARPRTKEFLIGWPALVLFIYYVKNSDWKFFRWVFFIASSILFASGINSFCHVFTPAEIIYMRVVNGLIIGAVVSAAFLILNWVFVKVVKYIVKAGKKNGILPD